MKINYLLLSAALLLSYGAHAQVKNLPARKTADSLKVIRNTSEIKPAAKPKKYILELGFGPVEFLDEETGEWKPAPKGSKNKKGKLRITIGEVTLEDVPEPKFGIGKIELYNIDLITGEIIPESLEVLDPNLKFTFGVGEVILEDVPAPSQLQTVINNGLQTVQQTANTIKSYIKGLFD